MKSLIIVTEVCIYQIVKAIKFLLCWERMITEMHFYNCQSQWKLMVEQRERESKWGMSRYRWVSLKTFWKRIYKETKRKRKISEKTEFEKIPFSKRKFSFHLFFSKYCWKRMIKHENECIGFVRTMRIIQKSRKSIRSGQKVKKRKFSQKNIFWKILFFSRDFSLSLKIFLFFSRFLSLSYFSLQINWNEIHLMYWK